MGQSGFKYELFVKHRDYTCLYTCAYFVRRSEKDLSIYRNERTNCKPKASRRSVPAAEEDIYF